MNYSREETEDSTFADSTLQPPPNDDGTLASDPYDSPDATFEIGEPGDEEAPVDLRASGMSLPDPEELKMERGVNDGCFKMWAFFILTFVCLLFLTVGLVVGLPNDKKKSSSSAFVPVTREKVRAAMKTYIVVNGVTNANDFSSSTSPQSIALDFLANEDPLQLNAPLTDLTSEEGYSFITRYVMTVFHAALSGDTWNYDALFKSRHETCEWFTVFEPPLGQVGVLCDRDTKTIAGVSFISNELYGTLPSELGVLTTLTYFESLWNSIEGKIPDRLQDLTNLQTVVLAFNNLSGSIPGWINKWSNLQFLYASNNRLTGSIPDSLVQLSNLSVLALDDNIMDGPVSNVWKLSKLKNLYLEDNKFSGNLPSSITSTSPLLVDLDLSSNKLTGGLPSDLFKLSHLEIIDLHRNSFGGVLPTAITSDNQVLTFVALHDNIISGSIPTQLGLLGQLEHLDLSNNRLDGDLPSQLANLRQLTYLFLGKNQFNQGPIPSFVYTFNNLRELSLKSTKRTGPISDQIALLTNLVMLELDNNRLTGLIPSEIGSIENLQFLLLNRNALAGQVPPELSILNNMRFLLIEGNALTGSIEQLCGQPLLETAIADCEEVDCSCCDPCCTDGVECHGNIEVANLDPTWESGYERSFWDISNSSQASGPNW